MIDFSLGEDLEQIQEAARRFSEERIRPSVRAFEEARAVSPQLLAEAQAIGFDRVDWPTAAGGAGLGALARAVVLQELAAGCPGTTLALLPMGSSAHALRAFGGIDALSRFDTHLQQRPDARAALYHDSRGALRIANGRISGTIPWVPAHRVDLLAILTRDGLAVITEGVEVAPLRGSGLLAAGASELRLQAAPVAAEWQNADAARKALAAARLDVAALLVGQMHEAARYSRAYAMERHAFGRPIAHHQALAFLIVDMHTAVQTARGMLHEAAWRSDAGLESQEAASAAFVEAAESALFIGPNAVQILGGAGFMRDHPVEKHMRELRLLGLLLGGTEAARRHESLPAPSPVPEWHPFLACSGA